MVGRFAALAAFLAAAALMWVACLERTYLDPNACSPTTPCSMNRYCDRGNCVGSPPDGFVVDMEPAGGDMDHCATPADCAEATAPACDPATHKCRGCMATNDLGAT